MRGDRVLNFTSRVEVCVAAACTDYVVLFSSFIGHNLTSTICIYYSNRGVDTLDLLYSVGQALPMIGNDDLVMIENLLISSWTPSSVVSLFSRQAKTDV
jgi:hypothetical protein